MTYAEDAYMEFQKAKSNKPEYVDDVIASGIKG